MNTERSNVVEPVEPCMWCDGVSTRLCDAPIGFEATGAFRDRQFRVTALATGRVTNGSADVQMWTCDAPMCDAHAKHVGFISGKAADFIDRCPHHAEYESPGMDQLIMFALEAEAKRREIFAEIRRARMRNGIAR